MIFKKEIKLFIIGLLTLLIGFINLICSINIYINKNVVERKSAISELLEIKHLALNPITDYQSIEDGIEECFFYEFYLKNLKLDENSENYEENKANIAKELENIQQTKGIYYSGYRDMTYYKYQERQNTTVTKQENSTTTVQNDKYPIATIIWNYLKKLGYNNYVCAGILGNIMAEVGGHTLDINPYLYDSSGDYYGICQWFSKYFPEVIDTELNTQLNFLAKTIKSEINNYGYTYKTDFGYNDFLKLTDAEDAALAFAQSYERCWSGSYSLRQANALKAYDYFVN